MRIEKVELVGYTRLATLNNIHEFIYTPTSDYQLILGTNGCGKSSVMRELSPLPPNKEDYIKGGRKVVHLTHDNSTFVFTSLMTGGTGKHSVLKDGVELNTSGLVTLQREIVKQQLGLDQELHDLLTDRIRFSRMRTQERRHWMTRLSTADYSYVMNKYKEFASRARDAEGSIKEYERRVVQQTARLLALEDMDNLDGRIADLTAELVELFSQRKTDLPQLNAVWHQYNQTIDQIERDAKALLKINSFFPAEYKFTSIDQMQEHIYKLQADLSAARGRFDVYSRDYADMETVIRALEESGADSLDKLREMQGKLSREIAGIDEQIINFPTASPNKNTLSDSHDVINTFVDIFSNLPDNSNRYYTKQRREEVRGELTELKRQIQGEENKIASVERRIEMIMSAKDSTCPKCGYVWKEGVSENEVEGLLETKASLEAGVKVLEGKCVDHDRYLEEIDAIALQYTRYTKLCHDYPRLSPLWDYVATNSCMSHNPKMHSGMIHTWINEATLLVERAQKAEDLDHIEAALRKSDLTGGGEGAHYSKRLARLEQDIAATSGEISKLSAEISSLTTVKSRIDEQLARFADLTVRMSQAYEHVQKLVEIEKNNSIEGVISVHQTQLAALQQKMTEKITLTAIIDDLRKAMEEMEVRRRALRIIEEELSPKSGLIASLVLGFINALTDHMNSVIAPIWEYDMTIQSCSMAEGDLDYKFPFMVAAHSKAIADVSEGSDGQVELFDFAFKLTAMVYHNLQSYPLWLDELGKYFDEKHRSNLMMFLKGVVDDRTITQVFLTSHSATQYITMNQAQACVLNPANIVVPDVHNEHVVMR